MTVKGNTGGSKRCWSGLEIIEHTVQVSSNCRKYATLVARLTNFGLEIILVLGVAEPGINHFALTCNKAPYYDFKSTDGWMGFFEKWTGGRDKNFRSQNFGIREFFWEGSEDIVKVEIGKLPSFSRPNSRIIPSRSKSHLSRIRRLRDLRPCGLNLQLLT